MWIAALAVAMATFWIGGCNYLSMKHLVVPTEGMSPTVNLGDHLSCVGIKNNDLDPIERLDILAYHRKPVPSRGIDSSTLFVQRVIGMPGEMVEMRKGVVYINGSVLDESTFQKVNGNDDRKAVKLSEESYFLMGDNRPNSEDSRYIGPVGRSDIECKIATIISKADYDNGKRW